MKTAHKEQIVMAFVLATGGRLPTDLGELLRAMRERIGDVLLVPGGVGCVGALEDERFRMGPMSAAPAVSISAPPAN
jgi:hypothetical protein